MANKRTHPKEWAEFLQAIENDDEETMLRLGKLFGRVEKWERKKGAYSKATSLYRYRDNSGRVSPFMDLCRMADVLGCSTSNVKQASEFGNFVQRKYIIEHIDSSQYDNIDFNNLPFYNLSHATLPHYRSVDVETGEATKWEDAKSFAKRVGYGMGYINTCIRRKVLSRDKYRFEKQDMTQDEIIALNYKG